MLPPMFLRLRVEGDKRRIRLWIPLIVLWPLVVVVVLLGTPVALLVAARSGHRARSRSVLLAPYFYTCSPRCAACAATWPLARTAFSFQSTRRL